MLLGTEWAILFAGSLAQQLSVIKGKKGYYNTLKIAMHLEYVEL